jgi:hypothetical protein
MKNLNIAVGMFIIGIAFACVSCAQFPIKGNGNLKTSERVVSSFEKISVGGSPKVRFYLSDEYRVVVTVDSNLDEYVEVYTRGDVLKIGTKSGNYLFTKYLVDVYCPILTGVSMTGSGQFSSNDTITTLTFDTKITGSGKIIGTISCNNYSAQISGSGNITITGNSKDTDINITGSGKFEGNGFNANNATIRITGAGKVSTCVTDNLDAEITGSGKINYQGDPKINNLKVTGSGRINRL